MVKKRYKTASDGRRAVFYRVLLSDLKPVSFEVYKASESFVWFYLNNGNNLIRQERWSSNYHRWFRTIIAAEKFIQQYKEEEG